MSIVFAMLAGTIPSAPPPPPMPSAPILLSSRSSSPNPLKFVNFEVEVRSGSTVLWSGAMRVSNRVGASFSRQQSDASAEACENEQGDYGFGGERSALAVNLSMMRQSSGSDSFDLRVNWDRPGLRDGCSSRRGTRTIALSENFVLVERTETVITGDGALAIRIRRRD
ncbi:MAG TPA: hypothetical protein VF503_01470 [Sphingobium sp.]|uniref:hypothetical protein n=1 Tax=Sphingobium sp. TaxID=1912891 RepID=UPI002ED2EB46